MPKDDNFRLDLGACEDCPHSTNKCFNALMCDTEGHPLVKCDNADPTEKDDTGRIRARIDITDSARCHRSAAYQKRIERENRRQKVLAA